MDLEQWLGAVDGGPRAETHHRGVIDEARTGHADRKDTPQRYYLAVQGQVGRRIPELAAELLAAADPARHPVRPPEQHARPLEVAPPQRLADQRTRHALALDQELPDLLHLEPMLSASRAQRLDRSLAAPREVEIVADDQVPRAKSAHQQPVNELCRAHALHPPVEPEHHGSLDPVERQRFDFLAESHQACWRRVSLEEFPRCRLEVTTVAGSPSLLECATSVASMCWCPR